jgi:hypothetical protein
LIFWHFYPRVSNFGQNIFTKASEKLFLPLHLTMPRPSLKFAQAKQQQINGQSKFSSSHNQSDSGSVYLPSEDKVSSDESITATKKLYEKHLPNQLRPKPLVDASLQLRCTELILIYHRI